MSRVKILHIVRPAKGGMKNHLLELLANANEARFLHMVVCPQGEMADSLKMRNIKTFIVPISGEFLPYKDFMVLRQVIALLRSIKPDIVHVHSSKAGFIGRLAAIIAGSPIIVMTVHGSIFQGTHYFKESICGLMEFFLSGFTHKIITVSEELHKEIVHRVKVNPNKVVTIYNGIKTKVNESNKNKTWLYRELGIPETKKIVGTVARLAPQKGIAYFIRAAELVLKEIKNVSFVVIGDGPLREGLERLSAGLGLKGSVYFTGERQDVRSIMLHLDVFVLASLTEGLPLTILEAMEAGCPLVATKVGGIPEVIEHGKNGLLVKPKDIFALAEAIKIILSDSTKSKAMGNWGRELVLEGFVIDKMVESTEKLYQELFNNIGTQKKLWSEGLV